MKKVTSYLSNLTFDRHLSDRFIAKYLANTRLVLLIITMIILIGYTSFMSLPRVLNPEIKIPIILISTVLPGAGPKDVESLITVPIEDAVNGISNVKTVTSSSQDSISVVQMEFNSGVDPDKARSDVQSAVDGVTGLPTEAQASKVIKLDFQNTPIWSFVLTGDTKRGSLEQFARILQQKLKDLPSIKDVTISGLPDQEIAILLRPDVIASYKINPQLITQVITNALGSYPAGTVRTDTGSFSLSIDPDITTVDNLRNLRLNINNTSVQLSDIAVISERAKPTQPSSLYATHLSPPQPAVSFSVFKTATANITSAVADAEKEVNQTVGSYQNEFHVATVFNTGEQINKQFSELIRDFTITVFLVFIVLFVFVGIRQAFVALLSSPLTFFITFTVMKLTGLPLSFIAIFSLLLSLGLLVDDTVVIISAMTAYFRTGKFTPLQAGLLVWRDFLIAIFTTTITTVWAFLPLLLATGIIGEFIKAIPIVVSTTLLASFFVAMLIILPVLIMILQGGVPRRVRVFLQVLLLILLIGLLLSILPKGKLFPFELLAVLFFLLVTGSIRKHVVKEVSNRWKRRSAMQKEETEAVIDKGIIHFEKISKRYAGIMYRILASPVARRRTITMVIIFSLFSYILLPLGLVRNEFFPKSDNAFVYVSLELPSGTNIETTTAEATNVLNSLRKTPDVQFVTLDIGQGVNQGTGGTQSSGSNTALYSLSLGERNQRNRDSITLASDLRNQFSTYQKGDLQVIEQSGGPPAGADLQIKLYGDDLTVLDTYANKVMDYLKTIPGTANINKSIKPGTSKLVFVPDKDKLIQAGITTDQLGFWLRLFASGFKANTIKLENETSTDKKDIMIRMNADASYAESINTITIPTQSGNVPLISLGKISLTANPTLITREDGKRTISISASVNKGFSVSTINKKLETYASDGLDLPSGYSWKTGGVNEENQNSVNSILQAMLLSFLLIIVTMVVQFNSFRRALIVMLVIPLSISGVFVLFALTQTPLSFPALIGVLALFGIVVKNSILIVDKIILNDKSGMGYVDAIVDAAESRLEPIALTSFATIVGLIPITLSNALLRGLGGAIISGLAFSGTIMLFFIPVVYFYWFKPASVN